MRTLYGIPVTATIEIDGETRTTWLAFVSDNADAFEAGDVDPEAIAPVILKGETYTGGGGASATYTVRLTDS